MASIPQEQLDRLEALAEAATPGPWIVDNDPIASHPVVRWETGVAIAGCPNNRVRPGIINAAYIAASDPQTVLTLVAELRAAREVVEAAPSVEHLRELVSWCDLIDKFASMVDEGYRLPRDEIQRDLTALANVLEQYHARRG